MSKLRKPLVTMLLAAAVLCAGCFRSKNVVTRVKPDGSMRLDGVTYALPRTVVQVRIPFKSTAATPGLYERYAPCFFPKPIADGRVRVEKTTFAMEQPTFSSSGEPDPDEHYIAKIKGGFFENKTMFLEFNPDGIITKGEASSENKAIDFAIKAARTAISVAATGLTPRGERGDAGEKPLDKVVREAEVDICRSVVVTEAASAAAAAAEAAAKAARKDSPPANPEDKTVAETEAAAARALVNEAELKIAAAKSKVLDQLDAQNERLNPQNERVNPLRTTAPAPDRGEANPNDGDGDDRTERAPARSSRRGDRAGRDEIGVARDAAQPTKPSEERPRQKTEDVLRDARKSVGDTSSALLNDVINLAVLTQGKVTAAATAAKPVVVAGGKPPDEAAAEKLKAATEAAKAAEEAAKEIDSAIEVVGATKPKDAAAQAKDVADQANDPDAFAKKVAAQAEKRATLAQAFANEFETAQGVYKRIEELRESRDDMTSGARFPSNLSPDAIKLLIEQADANITKFERTYFLGNKDFDAWTGDFKFVPIKADTNNINVEQTSQMLIVQTKGGLCPTVESNRQVVKIKPSFLAKDCPDPSYPDGVLKGGEGIFVRVTRVPDNDGFLRGMAVASAREDLRGERGFYYRIPAAAAVILFKSAKLPGENFKPEPKLVVARENMKVAQLGITASLPASSAGRTTQYTIDFNEATGAMKNFRLASNALLEASIAEEAGGAATDIITAKKARDAARDAEAKAAAAAAATAADTLSQKKKLLEELQTENAIDAELKKKADAQNPPEAAPETPPQP